MGIHIFLLLPRFFTILVFCSLLFIASFQSAIAKHLVLSTDEIHIPMGQSRSFDLGALPQKETTVTLDILVRLDAESYEGSSYFMQMTLNGQVINAARTRTITRIMNKNLVSPVAPDKPAPWYGNSAWRVLYAPSFDNSANHQFYEGDPFQTVLDVTDLINPAGDNKLEIYNIYKEKSHGSKDKYDLVLKDIEIHIKPGNSPMMSTSSIDQDVLSHGNPGAGAATYTGHLLPGGGFSVKLGSETFLFGTNISYPNAGMNKLSPSDAPSAGGQNGFKITTLPAEDGGQVIATGPDYLITRTVRFTSRKVEVTDQITNLHKKEKLGVLFENGVVLEDSNAKVRLAGIPDNSINQYYSPGNPSVYLALPSHGLGLIVEDDIFRNQATLFFDVERKTAGMRTDKLCLQPGGAYTLRWSVYPVASNDYYDFINLVRQDWGANYTLEGSWTFFSPDVIIATPVEQVRAQFTKLGINRACVGGGWVDGKSDKKRIGFGFGVLDDYWADYRNRIRMAAEKIHQAKPDCRVYVYYDTQRDTSVGGQERFTDSWLTNERGVQSTTDWGGLFSRTHSVVATLDNSFGKAMLVAADQYLSDMKVDGLYWDEMEGVGYGQPLITYNTADGYSCELDPITYTIKREIGITTIMGEKHRIAVINRMRERGGDIMGNGPICTKNILALQPQRMIEIQHNESWNYEGNLGSPLGYASSRTDFGNWIRALNMATLLVGTRYDYKHDIGSYVFPFTPIELHAGFLLGKERIIATHSGNFGWQDSKQLVQVRYFDANGKLTEKDFKTKVSINDAHTEGILEKGNALVLVRLPVTVVPMRRTATINGVQYDETKLKFLVDANDGFAVEMHTGEMAIKPGQEFSVKIDNVIRKFFADDNGVLRFEALQMLSPQEVEVTVM